MDPFRQTRESPILGADGRPYQYPVQSNDNGTSPRDGMPIPHVLTFSALLNSYDRVYYSGRWDEAMRHSRQDAVLMENDCFLMGLMQERTRAVTSLPWHLEIDDEEDPVQTLVRDHLTTALKRTPRFRYLLKWLYRDGTWKGRTAAQFAYRWEQVKDPNGMPQKTLTVRRWLPVNGDKINHTWDHVPTIRVNTAFAEDLPGAEYKWDNEGRSLVLKGTWRDRFQLYYNDPQDADFFDGVFSSEAVHGLGVRSVIFWWNWIRLERLSQASDYLERLGLGITLWYYDLGNPQSKAAVEQAAKDQSGRVNIILPRSPVGGKGQGLERVETPVSGAEVVARISQALEAYIERYVVGQSMSGGNDSEGSLGGTGRAEFAADTKSDITEEGASNLAESLTGSDAEFGLVRHLHKHTFPQYAPGTPNGFEVRFKLGVKDPKAGDRMKAIQTVVSLGVPVKADDARNAAGLAKPKQGDELCQQQMGMGEGGEGGPGDPPMPGGGGGKPNPRKGDWSPSHGPRGGKWEVNRKTGTKRHQRPQPGGGPRRFQMGADGRPEWVGPWRFELGSYNPAQPRIPAGSPEGGEWASMDAGQLQAHHESNLAGMSKALGAPRFGESHADAARTHADALMGIQAEMHSRNLPGVPPPARDAAVNRLKNQLGLAPNLARRFDQVMGTGEVAEGRRAANIEAASTRGGYERRAVDLGFTPRDIRAVVEDMRQVDLEKVRDHNTILKHATALLRHYGTDPGSLRKKLNDAQIDAPKISHLDNIATGIASEFDRPDLEDPERLLELIDQGKLSAATDEDLHEDALSYLEEMAQSNMRAMGGEEPDADPADALEQPPAEPGDAAEPAGDPDFDPAEFDERAEPSVAAPAAPDEPPKPDSPPVVTPSDLDPGPYKVFTWELERLLTKGVSPRDAVRQAKAAIAKNIPNALPLKPAPPLPAGRDVPAAPAPAKPQRRPGEPMHANDILLPSFRADRPGVQGDARDILVPSAPARPSSRRFGMREAVGQVLRWLAGEKPGRLRQVGPDRFAFDQNQPRIPAGQEGGGEWTDEKLGAHGDALHAHAEAGRHGKALDMFRQPPTHRAKSLLDELPEETVGKLDREAGRQAGLFGDEPADKKPAPGGKDKALRDLSVVQKRSQDWDMPQPGAMGAFRVTHLPSGNAIHSDPLSGQYVVKDKAGKKIGGPFEKAEEAAAHAEGGGKGAEKPAVPTAAKPPAKPAAAAAPAAHEHVVAAVKRHGGPHNMAGMANVRRHLAEQGITDRAAQDEAINASRRAGLTTASAGGSGSWGRPSAEDDAAAIRQDEDKLHYLALKDQPAAAPQSAAVPAAEPAAPPALEPGTRAHWEAQGRDPADFDLAGQHAPAELAAWQERVKHHKGLDSTTEKLKHRPQLMASLDALERAIDAAKKPRRKKFRMWGRPRRYAAAEPAPAPVVTVNNVLPAPVCDVEEEFIRDPVTKLIVGKRVKQVPK